MPRRIYRLIRQKRFQLELFTADFPRIVVAGDHKKGSGRTPEVTIKSRGDGEHASKSRSRGREATK